MKTCLGAQGGREVALAALRDRPLKTVNRLLGNPTARTARLSRGMSLKVKGVGIVVGFSRRKSTKHICGYWQGQRGPVQLVSSAGNPRITSVTTEFGKLWNVEPGGQFSVTANVAPILQRGKGVYTVTIWADINGESKDVTNYSIFVR